MVWVLNRYPLPSTNRKKIPPLPKGGRSINFQKLKNNQNSKETIKLTQIHTNKKNPKIPPLPRGGGLDLWIFKNWKITKIQKRLSNWLRFMAHGMCTQLVPHPSKNKKKSKKSPPFLGRRSISAPTTFRAWERHGRAASASSSSPYCLSRFKLDPTTFLTCLRSALWLVYTIGDVRRPYICTEWGLSCKAQISRSRCPK